VFEPLGDGKRTLSGDSVEIEAVQGCRTVVSSQSISGEQASAQSQKNKKKGKGSIKKVG
jgi:hypothetical protein